jgi:hypothetical protein
LRQPYRRQVVFGIISWKRIVVLSIVLQVFDVWIVPAATSFVLDAPQLCGRIGDETSKRAATSVLFASTSSIKADGSGGFQREQNTTAASPQNIKPTPTSKRHHTSLFGRKQNHPTTYEEHPIFKGPLVLPKSDSTSDARQRIGRYYYNNNSTGVSQVSRPPLPPTPLSPGSSTKIILQRIVEQLAYHDAPLDAKEVAESIEFYLRTYKRMMGATRRRKPQQQQHTDDEAAATSTEEDSVITVYDLCSGHGFTGMLYAACNPPKLRKGGRFERITVVLVDKTEPPSHKVLRDCLVEIFPWMHADGSGDGDEDNSTDSSSNQQRRNTIQFVESTLEAFASDDSSGEDKTNSNISSSSSIVLSTHACGSLTDRVIEYCCSHSCTTANSNSSEPPRISALAVMPCCYTGTDEGVPYGIRRALGVSMSADVRRSFVLQDAGYHVDFATIPSEITPMNRIIVGE